MESPPSSFGRLRERGIERGPWGLRERAITGARGGAGHPVSVHAVLLASDHGPAPSLLIALTWKE